MANRATTRTDVREDSRKRIRRIGGQVAGIARMVEEDRYCVDILLQVSAARAALDGLGKLLLRAHVESCIADAVAADRPRVRREKVDELQALLSRLAHIGGR